MTTMYGIPNCNTVKKARLWLDDKNITYTFHDYKKHGVDEVVLKQAIEEFGWEKVVNRAGMTWRKLSDEEKASITSATKAMKLMKDKPSVIKRPILKTGNTCLLGFNEADYATNFKKAA